MKQNLFLKAVIGIYGILKASARNYGEFKTMVLSAATIAILISFNFLTLEIICIDLAGYPRSILDNLKIWFIIVVFLNIISQQIIIVLVLRKRIVALHENYTLNDIGSCRKSFEYYAVISIILMFIAIFYRVFFASIIDLLKAVGF